MSRRPGIAKDWFDRYKNDVYPNDYVVIRDGIKCKPPRYFDNIFDIQNNQTMEQIKYNRKQKSKEHQDDSTLERLETRETVHELKAQKLLRPLE